MPRLAVCVVSLAALALSGCSLKASDNSSNGNNFGGAPVSGAKSSDSKATVKLGFPIVATRNTTRVAGSDPVADAAGVASALFPATAPATRPPAVVIADKNDWQGIVAAGVLSGGQLRAPILLSDRDSLPPVTSQTLDHLQPAGVPLTKGAQAVLIGNKPSPPEKLKSAVIKGSDPYTEAQAIDRFGAVVRGKPSTDVVVTTGEQPEFALPAAAWAARSGDAVLFVKKNSIPGPTAAALTQHQKPRIFILGPPSAVSTAVGKQLSRYGKVVARIQGANAVDNAITFAAYKKHGFGWGAAVPGQNITIANQSRPGDAAAAAGLGANGIFAPLLLTDRNDPLPRSLEGYLLDIQPGYENGDPSQGVFNHVWLLGAGDAVSPAAQDRIDSATALVPVDKNTAK